MHERNHWTRHARQWALVGPPLRPAAEDIAFMEAAAARSGPGRALILGVTPELVTMRWPAGVRVIATERVRGVIGAIFPATNGALAVQADWLRLPVADRSTTIVVGDGSPSNLAFPGAYHALAAELARVLVPGGRVALRLFAAPEQRETLGDVAHALRTGRIGSIDVLKWRLAMAIQPDDRNVAVADILRAFDEMAPDRGALARDLGWPRERIDAIDVYRGSALSYSFPTLLEVTAALGPAFTAESLHVPTYEAGERFPTLIVRAT